MVGCESKKGPKKRHVLKRHWTTFSNCVNHFRCHSQQNWGSLHDHLIIMGFFTLIMNRIFVHMSSKNYEDSGYMHDLDLLFISHQLRVSYPMRSKCNYLMGLSMHKNVYILS